uniref:ribonuclease H n=1 Tax=Cyprinus carpio carpio TaxID=630221 RepID=A0A9J8CAA1_CYPCA
MDIVGPLPKSARVHEHILVIVDYATRYPKALPLRKATAKSIAQELFLLASRVGLPLEILTDQGTPFMSRLMADLCRLLRVKQLRTTVYHPQTDGLVERFNQTLKQMLRRVAAEDKRDWDLMIPYVLFGIREVPQASTGFTPFELLFGRQPRGLLDVAREATLPFGLHGAPATFQRMMDILLRPHQAYAAAYLDDVVIHSEAWEEHLDRLRRVLSELRLAGLTANPRKCHLSLSEAKYLGFQVGRSLIRPQEKKVEAILSAPRPRTKTQVRAFLGLAGYYRCFIPNFSSLAAPLTDLTRKGQPEKVCWTPSAEEAFGQVKTALTSAPVLRALDFSCPFLLQTDASDAGLGAVLSQVQEGEEHPVIYISRKLSPAERNYAVVEKEALAIKWAVLELRYYLLGRKFTLVTDHAPLQWMARSKDTNARVTRWFLALQDFHFEVRHRAGAANANADGLSRIWTAYAGLSGVISRPPLTSPLLSPFIRRTRTTLGGGGM